MKKLFFCMAAAVLSCGMMQAETIAVNSEVADTIKISAAGTYTLQGDGTRCTMPVIVEENLGEVTLILNGVNIQVTGGKDSGISALSVRKGTNATINFQGVDTLKSKADPGCGLEAIGNVTLNGETGAELHCLSHGWAAGIGVSPRPKNKELVSGNITINSGIIEAKGDWEAPGIGAAPGCVMPNVTINGGFVTATGASGAAGIGTGYSQWDKCSGEATIAINGGTVIAKTNSSSSTLPIGVAQSENCTIHLVVAGGSLNAVNKSGAVYTARPIPATNQKGDSVVLFRAQLEGVTEATAITKGHIGEIVLGKDYLLKDVYTDNYGYVYFWLPKQADDVEVVLNDGENPDKPDQPDQPGDATTIFVNNTVMETIHIAAAGNYLLKGDGTTCGFPVMVNADLTDTVFVTAENVTVELDNNGSAMNIGANSVVAMTLKGANIFKGKNGCGIEAAGELIINGTVADTLDCKGSGRSAAIGTTKESAAGGNITINGGVIYARSGSESAAIGASNAGRLGNITINGGQIYATGDAYSSAIGASYCSTGDATITINGGIVEAQSGYYNDNRSIGKSKTHRNSVSVVILGGSVIAKGEKGEMNGVVVDATNGNESVVLFTYTLPEQPATLVTEGTIGDMKLGEDYGIKDVYTDAEGKLYFYLPESAKNAEVVINGVKIQGGEDPNPEQAIDEVISNATAPVKVMYNGALYIVRDGVMYTATGAVVR